MLCGIAWSGPTLNFFRVLQGIGSGPITPMAMVFRQRSLSAQAVRPGHGPVWHGIYVVLGGRTMFALASYWFSCITLERPMHWGIWMIVGRYITIGFICMPMHAASMMLLPPGKVRMGTGLINII
jgi:hypothetical protein